MSRGALRGAATAWLSLIALQAIGSSGGSGRVAGAFGELDRLVQRALDPTVPAIPDRRTPAPTATDGLARGLVNDFGPFPVADPSTTTSRLPSLGHNVPQ